MTTLPPLEYGYVSDVGLVRRDNEDSLLLPPQHAELIAQRGYLFVIADGVGGHQHGKQASQLCVQIVHQHTYGPTPIPLDQTIQAANTAVYTSAQQDSTTASTSMGTTLVAAFFAGSRVLVANVGDSRAYRVSRQRIMQLSQDHTMREEQVRAGILRAEQATAMQGVNPLLRVIGKEATIVPDYQVLDDVQCGEHFVLCSDGLTGLVADQEICAVVERCAPQEAAQQLVNLAKERGGPDNITVITLRVAALPFTAAIPATWPHLPTMTHATLRVHRLVLLLAIAAIVALVVLLFSLLLIV